MSEVLKIRVCKNINAMPNYHFIRQIVKGCHPNLGCPNLSSKVVLDTHANEATLKGKTQAPLLGCRLLK